MDFRRFKKYGEVMLEYFGTAELTVDTPDYVKPKYLDKIDKKLFKEFKRLWKQARREHIRECRLERKEERKLLGRKGLFKRLKGFFMGNKTAVKDR